MAATDTPETTDGRTRRRLQNRRAVVDAMLELLARDPVEPSMEAVAARAGLSARSVFRYFDSVDDLRRAVAERQYAAAEELVDVPPVDADLETRVDGYVRSRIHMFESLAGPARAARLRAADPVMAEFLTRIRDRWAEQVSDWFGPELAGLSPAAADDRATTIDAMTSFEAWDLLVRHHGRTQRQILRAWAPAVAAVVAMQP